MADFVLYSHPMSRGRIARWMIEETGAPYDIKVVAFEDMKSPDYLALNPMGKVPTLVHGKTVVTECAAICAYLAEAVPEAGLAPKPEERADYYRWMFFAAGPLEAAVTNRALKFEVTREQSRMAGYGNYASVMDTLEKAVSKAPYIAGDRFTAADVYVGSHIGWGLQFGSIEKRTAFEDYYARLLERPAHQRANEKDDALIAEMKGQPA
ncbi:glutathione S-transferase family protein [Microvirga pudoricolor]|uniref:glutathione S-transferase family protein n=1 Tax=Microvirga pudoricolor TaxID=2778729 RepID=UPI0019502F9E|nr:glutathione S-transferase family protein [Microvirga pudoricolor]MBM6595941.1 glutathione S-transferase family protein [Microvirga pudoricolor]